MLWWLAHNTILAALLACAVALVCRLGRLRPATRHALWLIVFLRLVLPPTVQWPWPALVAWPGQDGECEITEASPESGGEQNPSLAATFSSRPEVQIPEIVWLNATEQETDQSTAHQAESRPAAHADFPRASTPTEEGTSGEVRVSAWGTDGWLTRLAVPLWVLAGAAMALLQVVRILRFRHVLTHGTRAPDALSRTVEQLASQLNIRPPVTRVVAGISSPMIWGLGRPVLLWPDALIGRLTPECQRAVLVHELAHLRRRDHWVRWLQLVAGCMWWWHPLFRVVDRQLRATAELACDAWVVRLLPRARRAYAEALLEVSRMLSRNAVPLPAVGMASDPQEFERRLIMIMRESTPCRLTVRGLLVIGLLALLVIPGWSVSQQPKPDKEKPKEIKKSEDAKDKLQGKNIAVYDLDADGRLDVILQGAPVDNDRLDKLEKQLEELLKEVKAMRAGKSGQVDGKLKEGQLIINTADPEVSKDVIISNPNVIVGDFVTTEEQPLNLSRTTYKMPKDKAEALAAFLRNQVKGQVLETKIEGDSIVITTTPEAQKIIHDFIAFAQGRQLQKADFEIRYNLNKQ
jgi:beta-lactamase regulating signal transducer with metallopeptidase domain